MRTELYKSIKGLDTSKLVENDKEELLRFFMVTQNDLIRNQIAFIFSDVKYEPAVPFIFEKINDKSLFNNNSSLVHALEGFDLKAYFIPLVKIAVEHEYESRLLAYGIVEDQLPSISPAIKKEALEFLMLYRKEKEPVLTDREKHSQWHFLESTISLIQLAG
jgi:hypothetical protein